MIGERVSVIKRQPVWVVKSKRKEKEMKKIVVMTVILTCIALAGVHAQAAGSINQALVGSWDWVEGHVPGVLVLHADGSYFWIGVDYGAQGWRWSSRGGTVFSTQGAFSGAWFHYRLIDNNTLRIEYAEVAIQMGITGVFYLRRSR